MLRITRVYEDQQTAVLKLEGRVTADVTAVLRDAVMAAGKRVSLDLAEVDFMDRAGSRALRALRSEGVTLMNASPLILTLLATDNATG